MYLADALSRAYPEDSVPSSIPQPEFCHVLEQLELAEHLPISTKRLKQIQEATIADHNLQVLQETILTGWPSNKSQIPSEIKPYMKCHDELTMQDGILFKGSRIVIPAAIRKEMIHKVHEGHLGVESCLQRAREVLYWPLMNEEIRDYISNCSICNTLRPMQCREPLKSHEILQRPWSKVATDLFTLNGEHFVVTVDYYSNFIELESINCMSSQAVIQALKKVFGCHGIPEIVMSDNAPAYAADEFQKFASQWEFQHITSFPHYAQSNSKAESAVKICKTLLKKARLAKSDIHLALLNQRNTPTEPTNSSPSQQLFGRCTQTLLHLSATLLKPEIPQQIPIKLKAGQHRQEKYYNRTAKALAPLNTGDTVTMRLPGSQTWSPGICKKQVAPRSYIVESKGAFYRRNRKHIRKCGDNALAGPPDIEVGDSDSEIGEERDGEPEPDPAEPANTATQSQPLTSSFGRTIRPPK